MTDELPSYLKQGEPARLFPVLSTTSKEGRTTSIVLACLTKVEEFGSKLLGELGPRIGSRSKLQTFTEIVFATSDHDDRPDGLIVLTTGRKQWRALVETKIGNAVLNAEQVDRYRTLAKSNSIDCVVTISNQHSASPHVHPLEEVQRSKSRIPVYHWSWMHILTAADLLVSNDEINDRDQRILLNELRRFLGHESAGVKGFDRMPKAWGDVNKLVSSGGSISLKSNEAGEVVDAWHQEMRDLALILSRMTEAQVSEKLPKQHRFDPLARKRDDSAVLCEVRQLKGVLEIPNAAARLNITADLLRKSIDVSMLLRAPEDRQKTSARLNWLLRQLGSDFSDEYIIRLKWPGKSEDTQFPVGLLKAQPELAIEGKEHLSVHSFEVILTRHTAGRFAQQANFIVDLEAAVPDFYKHVGSVLKAWQRPAPRIRPEIAAKDVSPEAISTEADEFQPS